ncbi:MAG: hypothetical protein ABH873_03220 [Candidatus Firestonebacteria bacterium]
MYKQPEAMKEIHKIQEQLYEEMKHMTDKEKLDYINKTADEVEKKYNLKLKKITHVKKGTGPLFLFG